MLSSVANEYLLDLFLHRLDVVLARLNLLLQLLDLVVENELELLQFLVLLLQVVDPLLLQPDEPRSRHSGHHRLTNAGKITSLA